MIIKLLFSKSSIRRSLYGSFIMIHDTVSCFRYPHIVLVLMRIDVSESRKFPKERLSLYFMIDIASFYEGGLCVMMILGMMLFVCRKIKK